MAKDFLTDMEVEIEIERLRDSEAVKVAKAEQQQRYKRRQYMYTLRYFEKRGLELLREGKTVESFRGDPEDTED